MPTSDAFQGGLELWQCERQRIEVSKIQEVRETPVFILCGGLGTRLKEETEFRPKPMLPLGEHPILLHIMKSYAKHGFRKFVLCLGFKSDVIKAYFRNFLTLNSDFTVKMESNDVQMHDAYQEIDWEVTLCYTGEDNMTGSRVAQALDRYLGKAENFAVTYGDGLTDADLASEHEYHLQHGKIGTILGVNPPSRFGEIKLDGDLVTEFMEKPELDHTWINGGFFFFNKEFRSYLDDAEDCVLERRPLVKLSKDGQLSMYRHKGFWACMDTQRDREELAKIWSSGNAPWA